MDVDNEQRRNQVDGRSTTNTLDRGASFKAFHSQQKGGGF
jgi:hypothetical protein